MERCQGGDTGPKICQSKATNAITSKPPQKSYVLDACANPIPEGRYAKVTVNSDWE